MGRNVAQLPNEDPGRLARVMDAKYRCIGVDVQALKQQAAERKAAEAAENSRDLSYARLARYYDEQIRLKEQEAELLKSELAKNDLNFRNTHQLKDTRREWDLNRPDANWIDQPARVGDDDPRNGVSSLQKFDGEDLSAGNRKKEQMSQCKTWWEQQALEKAALAELERQENAAQAELLRTCDHVQRDAIRAENEMRRATNAATQEANSSLTDHRKALTEAEKKWDDAMANFEIESALANPVLSEDPTLATSSLSPYRVRKDHWKGMTPTEKQDILSEQFRQVEELKAKRQDLLNREAQWARMALETDAAIREQERRADDFRRAQAAERTAFLQAQAAEKHARDAKLADTYANKIAPEFFSQFGTSHR